MVSECHTLWNLDMDGHVEKSNSSSRHKQQDPCLPREEGAICKSGIPKEKTRIGFKDFSWEELEREGLRESKAKEIVQNLPGGRNKLRWRCMKMGN
jgi:hypothetical protein